MSDLLLKFWHDRLRRPFRLHYQVYGSGSQDILLIHGVASKGNFWQPLVSLLDPEQYRVIVPDLLGHGGSPRPGFIHYSTDDQAKAVLSLVRQLKLKSVIIVGHSMGGLVAVRLASKRPDLVKRLLVYEPPLFDKIPEFKTHRSRFQFYLNLYRRIASEPNGRISIARVISRYASNWQAYLESDRTWTPVKRGLENSVLRPESFEELSGMTIQTDIIRGRLDLVVPRGYKRKLSANANLKFHKTTERHGLTGTGAKYLHKLIADN